MILKDPYLKSLQNQYKKTEKDLFPAGSLSMKYDIHSIMHYDSFNNEKYNQKYPVIVTRNNETIKVNTEMSRIDIAKLNQMYPFKENSSAESTCNNLKNENRKLLEANKRLSENGKKCSEDKIKYETLSKNYNESLIECMNHLSEQRTFNLPVNPDVPFQEHPEWSSWSSYSECSASCGLGIKLRTRICRPVYNRMFNEITQCEGQNYDYQTCYERKCPFQSDDTMIQCQRHGESISKRLLPAEVPSYSQNKCLLYCKESNGRTFNTGKYVQNGTPCGYDSDDHFCILNKCQRVAFPGRYQRYQWGAISKWTCHAGFGSAKGTCIKTRKLKCQDLSKPKKPTRSNKKPQQRFQRVHESNCDIHNKPCSRVEFQCPTGCPKKGAIDVEC